MSFDLQCATLEQERPARLNHLQEVSSGEEVLVSAASLAPTPRRMQSDEPELNQATAYHRYRRQQSHTYARAVNRPAANHADEWL
jgi:hypothetical protein